MRRRALLVSCAAVLLASAGCTFRSEHEVILPWLLKRSIYAEFGNFGGSTQSTYFAKYWGFWRSLDAWNAVVLDGEHVLLQGEDGYGLLARGSLATTHVCDKLTSVSLPPGPSAVDCADGAEFSDGITGIAWRRFDARGRKLDEWTVSVVGPGRIFTQPARVFAYDDAAVPYFLMMNREAAADYRVEPRDCALVSIRPNDLPWVGPAELEWDACHRVATWEQVAGRRFHEAGLQRDWRSQTELPRVTTR